MSNSHEKGQGKDGESLGTIVISCLQDAYAIVQAISHHSDKQEGDSSSTKPWTLILGWGSRELRPGEIPPPWKGDAGTTAA